MPQYKNLARYHADGGSELISNDIQIRLAARNIAMTFSAPYVATGNAWAERSHRTIFESANTLLLSSGLGLEFWPEAVSHAVDVYNSLPTGTTAGYMSPLEAFTGVKPDLTRFKIFGCWCFAHIPKETRYSNTARGLEARYLGLRPNGKGYNVFRWDTQEIVLADSVVFDEVRDRGPVVGTSSVQLSPFSREKRDFDYLVGMCYIDERVLCMVTRVKTHGSVIVTERCRVGPNSEKIRDATLTHVAEVAIMVNVYNGQEFARRHALQEEKAKIEADAVVGMLGEPSGVGLEKLDVTDRRERPAVVPLDTIPRDGVTHAHEAVLSGRKRRLVTSRATAAPGADVPVDSGLTSPANISPTSAQLHPTVLSVNEPASARRQRVQRVLLNVGRESLKEKAYFIRMPDSSEYCFYINEYEPLLAPLSVRQALDSPYRGDWIRAMTRELDSLVSVNKCFSKPMVLPEGKRILQTRWVFTVKKKGAQYSFKARLVIKGFLQAHGVDYFETFAPTTRMDTLRMFL
jgi:hypothetical protein